MVTILETLPHTHVTLGLTLLEMVQPLALMLEMALPHSNLMLQLAKVSWNRGLTKASSLGLAEQGSKLHPICIAWSLCMCGMGECEGCSAMHAGILQKDEMCRL